MKATSNMSKRRKESKRVGSYTYTKFNELKASDTKVNVIGLIEVCDPPAPTKLDKTKSCCYFELVDESDTRLICNMSRASPDYVPTSPCYGDILCFRKVLVDKVESEGRRVILKFCASTSWLLFRKENNFKATSNFSNISLSINERCRLNDLKALGLKRDPGKKPAKKHKFHHSTWPKPIDQITKTPSSTNAPANSETSTSSSSSPAAPPPPSQSTTSTSTSSTASSAPSIKVSRPTRSRYYDTPLTVIAQQVVGNKEAAVVGVLQYFKPPTPSKGQDSFTVLSIVDESQHSISLPCVLFNPNKDKLPVATAPGQIMLLKGLVVNTFQGNLQARGHENTLVGIFPADPATPLPKKIGDWYTLKDVEKTRIQQLRAWAVRESPFLLNSKLDALTCDNFCTTLCLVVRVGMNRTGNMQLAVCDGTVPKVPLENDAPLTILSHVQLLYEGYKEQLSTVYLPASFKHQVIAGDVVQLVNLRMVKSEKHKKNSDAPSEAMELVIGDHSFYRGSINILPGDSPTVMRFKSALPRISTPPPPPSPSPPAAPVAGDAARPVQLSTVIRCEDSKHASLTEITGAAVGSMHVAEVQVLGVGTSSCKRLEDICQLRCTGCKTLYQTPHPEDPDHEQLLTAGDPCVCCSPDDLHEPNTLQYMYGFTLLITDHHTQMEVAVSGVEGARFLAQMQVRPANLYMDKGAWQSHLNLLQRMTGGADPFSPGSPDSAHQRPSLNLCIAVFLSVTNRRGYKIVNTNLCNL